MEGSSSLPAHSQFVHDFVVTTLTADDGSNSGAGDLHQALAEFKELTELTKASANGLEMTFSHARPIRRPNSELQMPPLERAARLTRNARAKTLAGTCWVFEYLLLPCPRFSELLLKVYMDPYSEIDAITINAVLYSLFMDEARTGNAPEKDAETEMDSLEAAAICRANLETALGNLPLFLPATCDTIIALLFGAYYAIEVSKPALSWSLISKACELSLALGYHRMPAMKGEEPEDLQFKQLVFWSVYFLDKSTSLRLGRASHISDWDISIPLPHDAELKRDASLGYFRSWLRAAKCAGQIYRMLYSADAEVQPSYVRQDRLDDIVCQLKEIIGESDEPKLRDRWYTKVKHGGDEKLAEHYCLNDKILRLSLLTLAYRASPSLSSSRTFPSECIAVAREAMELHQRCFSLLMKMNIHNVICYLHWTILFVPFAPFIVLFCHILRTGDPDDVRQLGAFVSTLDAVRDASAAVTQMHRVFSAIYKIASHYVEARPEGTPAGMASLHDIDIFAEGLDVQILEDDGTGLNGTIWNSYDGVSGLLAAQMGNDSVSFDWYNASQQMLEMLSQSNFEVDKSQ
ncbi:unnamed protein product [Clonostachys rosea]|uniref:Xylanolytic transcriptional activator regulatory domain-containing protein n=1 Tax=Bionectria ochroleuca TaxID=29856 RepID=A0ABY6UJV9_BIOOC|nr:unnamed protein product [Clonostachys rosea]